MARWSIALMGFYRSTCEVRENKWTPVKRIVARGYWGEPYYADSNTYLGEGQGYGGTGYAKCTKDINKAVGFPQQLTVARCVMVPELVNGGYRLSLFENKDGNYFATKAVNFKKAYNDGQYLWWDASEHFIYHYDPVWLERKVAIPGDVVAYNPYREDRPMWTELEQKHFLIMNIDGTERSQMQALKETYWDETTYKIPNPSALRETVYILPSKSWRKRRFHIPLEDLKGEGVDLEQMLTKELSYAPSLRVVEKELSFDKLRVRKVQPGDSLRPMEPRRFGPAGVRDGLL